MNPSITRMLNLRGLREKKSHFLFGPRQTAKTYLIHHDVGDVQIEVVAEFLEKLWGGKYR